MNLFTKTVALLVLSVSAFAQAPSAPVAFTAQDHEVILATFEELKASQRRVEDQLAALSVIVGKIGTGTGTVVAPNSTPAPLLPDGGGAINVAPPTKPRTSFDAFWEKQPAEVQVLRDMPVGAARTAKANELAAKGFALEKRIHVRGWNPLSAMKAYQEAGYTWVPALGQPDIPVSPGLTFFGKPSYDPANPPPGSIKVDTSFADGLEF